VTGDIYWITRFVESRKTAFAVARMCMITGLSMREFTPTSEHSDQDFVRVEQALAQILNDEELRDLDRYLAEETRPLERLQDPER